MRILIDLQACLTEGSRGRGVGRYSASFATTLSNQFADNGVSISLNGNFANESAHFGREFRIKAPNARVSYYRYPKLTHALDARESRVLVAEEIVRGHWASLHPDVLHIAHCFEGQHDDAVVPRMLPRISGMFTSSTVFDLIPLRFPKHYLADPATHDWYMGRLGTLRQFDLLIAISETSRQDAIEFLGIPESRIVTVWGGIDREFCPGNVTDGDRTLMHDRYGIRHPFLLYTGGDDFRKNLIGAIKAFSEVPHDLRSKVQFVIVCALSSERKEELLRNAESFGLPPGSIVLTQFIPEADLVTLYRACTAFIFPSLYEGLGLPVLEAMACGAPVIGSDNSAVKDVIARSDAMFEAGRTNSIVEKLVQILTNQDMQQALREHGLSRAAQFKWPSCVDTYISALNDLKRWASHSSVTVRARTLPRRRLALFSPLPPAKSGIADHTSILLPYLLQYFDVQVFVEAADSNAHKPALNVAVRSHSDFENCWQSFDIVMFEMGNSDFHAYMLPWLRRLPGVVTLHDAYLSGLFTHVDSSGDFSEAFTEEMLYSHGPRARRRLAKGRVKDPIWSAVIELPCTKSIIDSSIGVIAHSPYNLAVSEHNFPEGWPASFRIVPQLVVPKGHISDERRALVRRDLGYTSDSFVVATFGHVAWTKCGDQLLEGFERAATSNTELHLVFVGALADDDFGRALSERINSSLFSKRIRITGFVEPTQFDRYLHAADIAFQLRKNSRGGTPKGVLDCMSVGLPVAVNNEASYRDYPEEVLIKLASPSSTEVTQTIATFAKEVETLRAIGAAGRRYAETHHEPTVIAATYALVIHEFLEREHYGSRRGRLQRLARLAGVGEDVQLLSEIASALEYEWQQRLFARQRLLVDVTHLSNEDHGTGIPRVVKSILTNLYVSDRTGFEPVAVRLNNDGLLEQASGLAEQLDVVLPTENSSACRQVVTPVAGDVVLLLDSSWGALDRYRPTLDCARASGAMVVIVVYDLIPIRLPQYVPEGGEAWFRSWLQQALLCSDAAVCISRATADDLIDFIRKNNLPTSCPYRVGYWHLGADIGVTRDPIETDELVVRSIRRPALLMVGTIEPRKRHQLALDAMEILWQQGEEINLLIAGQRGWLADHLMTRIASHSELGQRLHLFESARDKTLQQLYQNAAALLFPSASEGFGLPLVEAAKFGLPVICSNIRAFKEVAGEHAFYADTTDPESLAASIRKWLSLQQRGEAPDSRKIAWQSWEQSAEQLLNVVIDNHWYKTLDDAS